MKKHGCGDDYAAYLFCEGTNFYAYDLLGAHLTRQGGSFLYTFRVWAPNAAAVFVCGDFNGWDESLPMEKDAQSGIWRAVLDSPVSLSGARYKYKVVSAKGAVLKADPYARASETRSHTASILTDGEDFHWTDEAWQEKLLFLRNGVLTAGRLLFRPQKNGCLSGSLHRSAGFCWSSARIPNGKVC